MQHLRVRSCVCSCVCPSSPPHDPAHTNSRNPPHSRTWPLTPVPASIPASNCTTYPWEELPRKKCPISKQSNTVFLQSWKSKTVPLKPSEQCVRRWKGWKMRSCLDKGGGRISLWSYLPLLSWPSPLKGTGDKGRRGISQEKGRGAGLSPRSGAFKAARDVFCCLSELCKAVLRCVRVATAGKTLHRELLRKQHHHQAGSPCDWQPDWGLEKHRSQTLQEAKARLSSTGDGHHLQALAWLPLQSLAVKKNFFCANFRRWKTFKICWKVPVKYF